MPKRFASTTLWIGLAVLTVAVLARLIPGPRTIDDSFITFRYAQNILAGNGFVYNPGDPVLGTTTPLYTLLLVTLSLLAGGTAAPFPWIALVVNAVADGLTCLLLFRLGKDLGSFRAGAGAALVWAIAPFSVSFAIGGLETSLYILLLTAVATAYLEKRYSLAAVLSGLALLTRPDALILIGPLAADRFIQFWRANRLPAGDTIPRTSLSFLALPWQPYLSKSGLQAELSGFLAPVLPWLLFSGLYFGSPIPHSITAKSLAYQLGPEAAFVRLLQHYATPFQDHLTFGLPWIGVGLILYPFLFLVGARRALKANVHCWSWLAYPWLYFAAFAIANPLIFRWYLSPPLPALILTILIGLEGIFIDLFGKRTSPSSAKHLPGRLANIVVFALVVFAPFILSLRDWKLTPDHGLSRPAPEMAWYKLELLYRQAAGIVLAELDRSPLPSPVLAAGDVGVLGYFTGLRILDTVGLNSPESTRYYPADPDYYVINYAIPPALILDQKPDFIVILEVYGRAGLLIDQQFQNSYHLLQKIPTDIYGSDGMLIFERKADR